jgi:hypothetical protein
MSSTKSMRIQAAKNVIAAKLTDMETWAPRVLRTRSMGAVAPIQMDTLESKQCWAPKSQKTASVQIDEFDDVCKTLFHTISNITWAPRRPTSSRRLFQ